MEEIVIETNNLMDLESNYFLPRSQWWSNEYFRGSYSHRNLRSNELGVKATDLAEPLYRMDEATGRKVPVVMFAGEALHSTYYSTVHGAFESGKSVALDLIRSFTDL
ncbi:unnamed protein product [Notodromas monacha]|uniref:Amine oxidase domain-containing protein n=1 Tax=Notodromas monacha TaxID=399045 RepID=A0A7R9BHI8_9CRUS|nr:unnamed protein product [Notodromas monacha]CAG0914237.1 unnamed protein product [Notodromas monacha]